MRSAEEAGSICVWVLCPACGGEISGRKRADDAAGVVETTCPACGTISLLDTRDGYDVSVTSQGLVEDVGQPRCDGSCGAEAAFVGTPCRWDCCRAVAWKKALG